MRRSAFIFILAIFLPSLVLGWLALRTAGDQGVLIERQAAGLHQAETDAIATQVQEVIEEKHAEFVAMVRGLVVANGAPALADSYGPLLQEIWTGGGIPFAISPAGTLSFPRPGSESEFLQNNSAFLGNRTEVEVYTQQALVAQKESYNKAVEQSRPIEAKSKKVPGFSISGKTARNILPQKSAPAPNDVLTSKVEPEVSDFQSAISGASNGILARFVQNDLQVLFWTRPEPGSNWLFGLMLGPVELDQMATAGLPESPDPSIQLAIVNDKTRPVGRVPAGFTADWKHPFVATEIGELLPHWEVALYLTDPGQLTESARLVSLTLILLIALALAAILAGGYFVAADTRRQLALAQKKTDFVSNVSHELKTPLTSIRMFADLLADGRVEDPEKRHRYLRIIADESERLTRLVNNVLDFARMEKHRKIYEMRAVDLHPVVEKLWETEGNRLREAGFQIDWDAAPPPYPVVCDADAIAQVLVNLLANAEKYATRRRDLTLRTAISDTTFEAEVLDRGPGIPHGLEEKIFEAFFRADDSLSSGVQGSGLGLTLARQIARDHSGDLTCHSREGGGTRFLFTIPTRQPIRP